MTKFKLQFPEEDIPKIAGKWDINIDKPMFALMGDVYKQGWLTRQELQQVADWLWPTDNQDDSEKHILKNPEESVAATTAVALSSCDSYTQWWWLLELRGVQAPVASATLHWFAEGNYPIASKPALRSCGIAEGKIAGFCEWYEYTQFCRKLAVEHNITMRTLDRALCQYDRQPG